MSMIFRHHLTLVCFVAWLCGPFRMDGQTLYFSQVGADQGMRTLASWYCVIDRFGNLWISTADGLVRYNAYETFTYYNYTHPELASDQIGSLFFDRRDNLWICNASGLTKMDSQRQLHRQYVIPNTPNVKVDYCIDDGNNNIIAICDNKSFLLKDGGTEWISQPWLDSLLSIGGIRNIQQFDKDIYIFSLQGHGATLINFTTQRQVAFYSFPKIKAATKLNDAAIAIAGSEDFMIVKGVVPYSDSLEYFAPPEFFPDKSIISSINYVTCAKDGCLYITTDGAGLIKFDPVRLVYAQFLHEPSNPFSILENTTRYITSDALGNIVFTSHSGANYANVYPHPVQHVNYFKNAEGKSFDQRVPVVSSDALGKIWMVMERDVLVYDPEQGTTEVIQTPDFSSVPNAAIIPSAITTDKNGLMWIGYTSAGIAIYDKTLTLKHKISVSDFPKLQTKLDNVRVMEPGNDSFMYVGSENGLFRVHQTNYLPDTFRLDKAMKPLRHARIVDILPLEDQLWVSTSPNGAAWQYDWRTRKMKKFRTTDGLVSNRVYGLERDDQGAIYIGSNGGLNIIYPNGEMETLNKGEGLPSTRIESIVKAKDGTIWLTNTYNLLQFDPATKKIRKITEPPGVAAVSYHVMSGTRMPSGKLVFGTNSGIVIVDSEVKEIPSSPLDVFIFYKNTIGQEFLCSPEHPIHLRSDENTMRFSFGVNDLSKANKVTYRYRLQTDEATSWSDPSSASRIDFKLKPGTYYFEVEASYNDEWHRSTGPIQIKIDYPWWQRWWVLTLTALALGALVWSYFRRRINKYKNEISITRRIADLESKALRAQMNPHFVFNSLNAIQECIVTGRVDEAYTYLSKFARLLRMVLEHSERSTVTLQEELEVLSLYVSLEQLRFLDTMEYKYNLDESLDAEEINIPPMLIQPHLENAIWHGLRHKSGPKQLIMDISEKNMGYIEVIISDNGIGRVKAEEIGDARLGNQKHKSKGKQLSSNRIDLLQKSYPMAFMEIIDLYDEKGIASGTKIVLSIPIVNKKSDALHSHTP